MPTSLYCPHCGTALSVTADQGGKTLSCPTCQQPVQIPGSLGGAGGTGTAPPSVLGPAPQTPMVGYPRPRGGPNVALIVIGVLAVVGVIVVGVVAWSLFSGKATAMRYMPDDCEMLATVDVAGFLDSPLYKKILDEFPDSETQIEQAGQLLENKADIDLKIEDFARLTFGASGLQTDEPEFVVVAEMKQAAVVDKLRKRVEEDREREEKKVAGHTIYTGGPGVDFALCFPGDRLIVVAPEDVLRDVLKRDGEPKLDKQLQRAWSGLDASHTVLFAVAIPKNLGGAKKNKPAADPLAQLLEKAEALGVQVAVESDIEIAAMLGCTDAQAAKSAEKILGGLVELGKGFLANLPPQFQEMASLGREFLDSVEISSSGDTVRAKATITSNQVVTAARKAKAALPGAVGGIGAGGPMANRAGPVPGMGRPPLPPTKAAPWQKR